ncbi:unnamed protein product [Microthlaspi erraticum]|uniref:Uncharacterized protein n=1 Tax=Microthlaspi erraticum TaxID=1685480 RepID=A0A6D2JZ50_9BRAS|nr:unnamed protein product [Microthlaspi erraticum]
MNWRYPSAITDGIDYPSIKQLENAYLRPSGKGLRSTLGALAQTNLLELALAFSPSSIEFFVRGSDLLIELTAMTSQTGLSNPMLRMFGTGLKVSRSFLYSSVSELTYPSEESLVKATCRDPPMIALLKAHLPTDPFPQHKRADLLLLVPHCILDVKLHLRSFPKFSSIVPSQTSIIALAVARNGLPSINGSVGSSSISSTMKSVGISTFPISKAGLQAFQLLFLEPSWKGQRGLYGGGPDGVSFFFATGLVGWLELALSVLLLDRALVCLAESRFLQLDRVLVQGFVPARSSSVRNVSILDQILPFLVIDVHSDLGWATPAWKLRHFSV